MRPGIQTREQFECKTAQAIRMPYLLFLPQDYEKNTARSWPLMLFLHGSGERGNNPSKVAAHGPPRLVKSTPDFPFIVVSPQCARGQIWSSNTLQLLLDCIETRVRADSTRVYLTGLSMGGYGAWKLGVSAPERFAAIVPICGGGDMLPLLLADPKKLKALRTLGVWAFHGARDPVVPLSESESMVAAFRRIGNKAKLTVYPDAAHDSWTETYKNPDLYDWLLEHRRPER
jgi:predicted peptidase